MDGKISEIIDNVLDTDDYINSNTQESFNSANSWNKLTYLDNNKLFKKDKDKTNNDNNKLPSPIESEKIEKDSNKNEINININNTNNEPKKILNENLFKGKGFRTNIDFFLKNNSENLSLSGINDISSLAEYPNVFTCAMPRPGTNRYKKANKTNLFYNSFYAKENKGFFGSNINNKNHLGNSVNKKTLPKIEERKNPGNKIKKNKTKNK